MKGFFSKDAGKSKSRPDGKNLSCVSCGLYTKASSPKMQPFGNNKLQIMNVVQSPGNLEDKRNKWLQGDRGRVIRMGYKEVGIDVLEDCVTVGAVNCSPLQKNKSVTPNLFQIECCRRINAGHIKQHAPKVIVLFGKSALQSIIGQMWKKDLGSVDMWRGFVIPSREYNAWIYVMQEPTTIIQNKEDKQLQTIWNQDFKRIKALVSTPLPKFIDDTKCIEVTDDIDKVLDTVSNAEEFAFDIETTGLKPHREGHQIACISFAVSKTKSYCIPYPTQEKQLQKLKNLLQNNAKKIAANMKFEFNWIYEISKINIQNLSFDTMIAAHVLDNRQGVTGLKFNTFVWEGVADYDSSIKQYLKADTANSKNRVMEAMQDPVLKKQLMEYCALDSLYTFRIKHHQQPIVEANPDLKRAYNLMHEGAIAFAFAERQGMRIDLRYCRKEKRRITQRIEKMEIELQESNFIKEWKKIAGHTFNLNSGKQMADYLYNHLGIKAKKKTQKGTPSVDEEALGLLGIEELDKILNIRKLQKLRDTYLNNFLREQAKGIMHPFFNLHTVRTYRSSSDRPNFQNLPKRDKQAMKLIRGAIFPRKGHQIMEADFSKLEVSIAACYHKDPTMMDYLKSDHNDMHGDLAQQIFLIDEFDKSREDHDVLRSAAKNAFIFPQFYGDYYGNNAKGLVEWVKLPHGRFKAGKGLELKEMPISDHLISKGIKSLDEFTEHLKSIEDHFWNNRFKEYGRWKKRAYAAYQKRGYIDLLTGFRISGVMRKNEVLNYPVQGAAFHCLLWSFNRMHKIIQEDHLQTRLIGQIHDAMILDVHPDELDYISNLLVQVTTIDLPNEWNWIIAPLQIDAELCPVDGSFAEKEKYKLPKL